MRPDHGAIVQTENAFNERRHILWHADRPGPMAEFDFAKYRCLQFDTERRLHRFESSRQPDRALTSMTAHHVQVVFMCELFDSLHVRRVRAEASGELLTAQRLALGRRRTSQGSEFSRSSQRRARPHAHGHFQAFIGIEFPGQLCTLQRCFVATLYDNTRVSLLGFHGCSLCSNRHDFGD